MRRSSVPPGSITEELLCGVVEKVLITPWKERSLWQKERAVIEQRLYPLILLFTVSKTQNSKLKTREKKKKKKKKSMGVEAHTTLLSCGNENSLHGIPDFHM